MTPSPIFTVVICDGKHIFYADVVTEAQAREIVQIIQKHKPLAH